MKDPAGHEVRYDPGDPPAEDYEPAGGNVWRVLVADRPGVWVQRVQAALSLAQIASRERSGVDGRTWLEVPAYLIDRATEIAAAHGPYSETMEIGEDGRVINGNHRIAFSQSMAADGPLSAIEGHPDTPAPAHGGPQPVHTPGPWSLGRWGLTGYEIQAGGRSLAIVNKVGETYREQLAKRRQRAADDWRAPKLVTQEEAAADARLMCAAPDLLEACEDVRAFLNTMLRGRSQDSAMYRRLLAAITRARGMEQ